jgi:hypothetical protein
MVVLLLLLHGAAACAGRCAHAQGVLAVRQPDAAALNQSIKSVPVQVIQRLGSKTDIFKL